MYDYLIGTVTKIEADYIALECNNVGFKVHVASPFSFKKDSEYKIEVYCHIREDENSLFGFKTEGEKELFMKLISVKGIGPKMTLPILAMGDIGEIRKAIDDENVNYLKKFPKIGDKVARQIILDLKGKLDFEASKVIVSDELNSALKALGYKEKEIKSIANDVDRELPIEKQIKEALKLLLK